MKLYLYEKNTLKRLEIVEGRIIDNETVILDDGSTLLVSPMCELSSKPDMSERLLEIAKIKEPCDRERIELLEELMAKIMYGGTLNEQI